MVVVDSGAGRDDGMVTCSAGVDGVEGGGVRVSLAGAKAGEAAVEKVEDGVVAEAEENGLSGAAVGVAFERGAVLHNYSGMHAAAPAVLHSPASLAELEELVRACHDRGVPLRPVGRFLSPNGIAKAGHPGGHMVSLADMDRIVGMDEARGEVTVQAGALVGDVVAALAERGWTLSNFSSISEQRMAGWVQVAAHGTGASLATVDEMVVAMKVVTPALGTLTLRRDDPATAGLFRMMVAGVGALGVVAELTLSCVPSHKLRETVAVLPAADIHVDHAPRLRRHRHVRYHFIPHTDDVVVAVCDPVDSSDAQRHEAQAGDSDATAPLVQLLDREMRSRRARSALTATAAASPTGAASADPAALPTAAASAAPQTAAASAGPTALSFADLRGLLLDLAPLDVEHVKRVNAAEAEFWRRSQGTRVGPSPDILGFDCGGQQLVLEVCLPAGTDRYPNGAGVAFVRELLGFIRRHDLPAHAPIEQRWTASSRAFLSPAYSEDPSDLFSWVGIITYLPPGQNETQRRQLAAQFDVLVRYVEQLSDKYGAVPHWAKIEMPHGDARREEELRKRLHARYPLAAFASAQQAVDPKGICGADNPVVQRLLLTPPTSPA